MPALPRLRRVVASLSVGTTLTFVLAGCPIIAGLDHDYSAPPGVGTDAASDSMTGTDTGGRDVALPDGAHPRDGGRDAHMDGTRPTDAPGVDGPSDDTGTTNDSGGDVVTPPTEGGADAACPASCTVSAMPGWTLVAFDPSGMHNCPGGYIQSGVATATGVGTCTCGSCVITPTPDCGQGSVTSQKNASVGQTSCGVAGDTYSANQGLCVAGGIVSPPQYSSFMGTAPAGGSCSATSSETDPPSDPGIVCQSATTCATSVCDTSLSQMGFKTCLYQAGDQTCPAGLSNKHAVGSSITTQCDTCTCSVGTTTCTGSFNIYSGSTGCAGGLVLSVPVTGACTQLSGVVTNDSYQYVYTTHPSCNPGTSNATNVTNDPATICCP